MENILEHVNRTSKNKLTANAIDALHKEGYLNRIFGSRLKYHVTEDIRNAFGALIVKKGDEICSDKARKITNHKLLKSLDECIAFENKLSIDDLNHEIHKLQSTWPSYGILLQLGRTEKIVSETLQHIQSDTLTLNKLTVLHRSNPYFFSHSVATSVLSILIGAGFGLTQDELIDLGSAALCHDFGKIFIRPEIWAKQDLSDAEFRHVSVHPIVGYHILNEAQSLMNREYTERRKLAVLNHHELLNGCGYPRRLTEESIGLLERIIALSSTYDNRMRVDMEAHAGEETCIGDVLRGMGDLAGFGLFYDPDCFAVLANLYAPYSSSTGKEGESPASLKRMQDAYLGIQKSIDTILLIASQVGALDSGCAASGDLGNLISSARRIRQVVTESGLIDQLCASLGPEEDPSFQQDVKDDTLRLVSEVETSLQEIDHSLELLLSKGEGEADGPCHGIRTFCDMIRFLLETPLRS